MYYQVPPGGHFFGPKHIFTPIFRLHTCTKVFRFRNFGSVLRNLSVLIEIYPLVPFPPSVREGVSDVTADALQWWPMTSARAFTLGIGLAAGSGQGQGAV